MKKTLKHNDTAVVFSLVAIIFTAIGYGLYTLNVASEGYFNGGKVAHFDVLSIAIIGALVVSFILTLCNKGSRILSLITGILLLASIALIAYSFLTLINDRVYGFGVLFFSNQDVLDTMQTPENMVSAFVAIGAIAMYVVAWLITLLRTFMNDSKKVR